MPDHSEEWRKKENLAENISDMQLPSELGTD
jgi:hypothetical protein